MGGFSAGAVTCSSVLQAASLALFGPSDAVTCRFDSPTSFIVQFNPAAAGSSVAVGSSISFITNLLRSVGPLPGTFSLCRRA
jgi:hypothetical protein